MTTPSPTKRVRQVALVVTVNALILWIISCCGFVGHSSLIKPFTLAGHTRAEYRRSDQDNLWLSAFLLGIPVLCAILAALANSPRWLIVGCLVGVALVVVLARADIGYWHDLRPAPSPAPQRTLCVPVSGGHTCPGG